MKPIKAYAPHWPFRNPHFNTIAPHLFRSSSRTNYLRTRIETADGDFLDIDRLSNNSTNVVLLLHGLEGSSKSHYIKGMANYLSNQGIDVVVMNFRGCSGELNRFFPSYHSGKTDDLHEVTQHLKNDEGYKKIMLLGFSLGGNILLKYLGERGSELDPGIIAGVAISVPCDLSDSAKSLGKRSNQIYMKRFMRKLKQKIHKKIIQFPDSGILASEIEMCKTFIDFDNLYTAPAHGFNSAEHYWKVNSSKQFIPLIKRNTLIINSLDDPFFGEASHPFDEAANNPFVELLSPLHGGHVGFSSLPFKRTFWHEKSAWNFFNTILTADPEA